MGNKEQSLEQLVEENVELTKKLKDRVDDDVMFVVMRKYGWEYVPKGKITFNQEDKDSTNSFTDGVFRAPLEGTYWFQFNGYVNSANDALIHVSLNDALDRNFYDTGSSSREV